MLLRHGLLHSHEIGGLMEVREICAFADHFCMGTADLVQITGQPTEEVRAITFCAPEGVNVTGVTAYYTENRILDEKAVWIPLADLPFEKNTVSVEIPDNAAYFYVNITDDRGCEVSSRVVKL